LQYHVEWVTGFNFGSLDSVLIIKLLSLVDEFNHGNLNTFFFLQGLFYCENRISLLKVQVHFCTT
jgi:hypothetical protein